MTPENIDNLDNTYRHRAIEFYSHDFKVVYIYSRKKNLAKQREVNEPYKHGFPICLFKS